MSVNYTVIRSPAPTVATNLAADARLFQIATLASLLVLHVSWFDLGATPLQAAVMIAAALAAQYAFSTLRSAAAFDWRSALITGLSLILLLGTSAPILWAVAPMLAIASKFLIRSNGKHFFNPATLAIVILLLLSPDVWVSPGQWGQSTWFGLLLVCSGGLVLQRAGRADTAVAFLSCYAGLLFWRAWVLGDPLAIPLNQLQSGALLLFSFFMITDPRSTPDHQLGRILFAASVALLAYWLQFRCQLRPALFYALAAMSPLTPMIDRILPAPRFAWRPQPYTRSRFLREIRMRQLALAFALLIAASDVARAFCGFYVSRADSDLFNKASKVVLAHNGDKTVLTMASDVKGDPEEFAIVIPVPTVIQRDQIRVIEPARMDRLDAYTAPRLVEYYDEDPCLPHPLPSTLFLTSAMRNSESTRRKGDTLGVTVEATYSVGEYDIVILSARDSSGLLTWLDQNGYKVPRAAEAVVSSYLRQNLHFFLAKVNLERQSRIGFMFLRPIQIEYESSKFMLPIRLGTVNAEGPQELIILGLSPRGRIETTNYRTVQVPTGPEVPLYVKASFGDFYRAMFDRQVAAERGRAVFLEYAWDMSWCDPCAANPLSADELKNLGVFWLDGSSESAGAARRFGPGGGQPVFATRLHVRYDRDHFPEDLMLQETADRQNFQGRYVLRHPYPEPATCDTGVSYRNGLPRTFETQARNLVELTGWELDSIRERMRETGQQF